MSILFTNTSTVNPDAVTLGSSWELSDIWPDSDPETDHALFQECLEVAGATFALRQYKASNCPIRGENFGRQAWHTHQVHMFCARLVQLFNLTFAEACGYQPAYSCTDSNLWWRGDRALLFSGLVMLHCDIDPLNDGAGIERSKSDWRMPASERAKSYVHLTEQGCLVGSEVFRRILPDTHAAFVAHAQAIENHGG